MTGLVFAFGVLLALGGVVSVISGAPIIQLERGWAEVIAGTVALTGGVVTVAIGVVLLRLRVLVEAVRRLAQPLTDQLMIAPPAPTVLPEPAFDLEQGEVELRPTRDPDEPVFVASDPAPVATPGPVNGLNTIETVSPEPRRPLWASKRNRAEKPAEADVPTVVAPPTVLEMPDAEPPAALSEPVHRSGSAQAEDPDIQAPPSITPDLPQEDAPPPRRILEASSDLPARQRDVPARTSSFFGDWRSKPLLRSRHPTPAIPEVLPPLFDASPGENEAPPIDLTTAEKAESPVVSIDPPAEAQPSQPEPAVIGRYQAGASSYTMYADGAIDVETEGGDRHRFGSMDELKAFIARQEQALS